MSNTDPHFDAMSDAEKDALPKFPWDGGVQFHALSHWRMVDITGSESRSRMICWEILVGGYRAQLYPDGFGVSVAPPGECYQSWTDFEAVSVADRKALCLETIEAWASDAAKKAKDGLRLVTLDLALPKEAPSE